MLMVYAFDKMRQTFMHENVFNIYGLWLEKSNIIVFLQPLPIELVIWLWELLQ